MPHHGKANSPHIAAVRGVGIGVFMLPLELPVALSPIDLEVLQIAFDQQAQKSVWYGFTILKPHRRTEGVSGPTRAVLFVASSRIGHLTLMRQLGGTYALYDGSNKVIGSDSDLYRLLGLFRGSRRPVH